MDMLEDVQPGFGGESVFSIDEVRRMTGQELEAEFGSELIKYEYLNPKSNEGVLGAAVGAVKRIDGQEMVCVHATEFAYGPDLHRNYWYVPKDRISNSSTP